MVVNSSQGGGSKDTWVLRRRVGNARRRPHSCDDSLGELMLSRVAESVYWMNRYVERAENVARFIDVNQNLTLGEASAGRTMGAAGLYDRRPRRLQ